MKLFYYVLWSVCCLSGLVSRLQAQPQVDLRVSFNTEQNRYEVFAKPNFSAKNFTWGPSQVSIVLPADVANEPLSIRSTNVGSWADNSVVFAPTTAPKVDFHGMTSPGGKVALVAGEEFLLFDFSLKSGYVANVRLFNAAIDPTSDRMGMQGGDFRSYMSDQLGTDYLRVDSRIAELVVKAQATPLSTDEEPVQVVAYPNPTVGSKFRLYLKGFVPQESVKVNLLNLNGVALRSFEETVETLSGRVIDLSESVDGYILLSLERQATHQIFTQKLWFR